MEIKMRIALLAAGLASLYCGSPLADSLTDAITRQSRQNFPEYLEMLSIPNVADRPEDIRRNARFLQTAFAKRGFDTHLLDNPAGRPAVFAQLSSAPRGAKTILFYIHFDGQPVIPEEWAQKNPFDPVVKRRDSQGQWREVGRDLLSVEPLDPELRVFARSASDDKAPISMFLTAIDVIKSQGRKPAFNIKVLLDPEEEMGSPSLAGMMERNRTLVAADAQVILDGPLHDSGRPTLVFGNRGIAQATLTVFGPRAPLHSGHFGNYAPNPAMRLAQLLATMKDENGRVLVDGYYKGIELSAADKAALAAVGDDASVLLKRAGVARSEKVGENYQEALQYPSLNVRGMKSAAIGEKAANIVPSEAIAEFDMRTTPDREGRELYDLIRRHIERQGYHLVEDRPSEEERARYDKLASFRLGSVQAAARTPMDTAVGRWALHALSSDPSPGPKAEPVRIRMVGGTVPTDILVAALEQPFVLVPTVNPDNNQHAHDENLRIGNYLSGTRTIYSLLTTPYRQ